MAEKRITCLLLEDDISQELVSDIKDYLLPLRTARRQIGRGGVELVKYREFVIELLKTITQKLTQSSSLLLLAVVEEAITSFLRSLKAKPASHRLLQQLHVSIINIYKRTLSLMSRDSPLADAAMNLITTTFETLYEQLINYQEGGVREDNEKVIVGVANTLWEAARIIESKSCLSSKTRKALTLRQLSINSSLLLPSQLPVALQRALSTDKMFRKSTGINPTSSQLLSAFHVSLLNNKAISSLLKMTLSCDTVLSLVVWMVFGSRHSYQLRNSKEVKRFVSFIQSIVRDHVKTCSVKNHSLIDVMISLYNVAIVSLSSTTLQSALTSLSPPLITVTTSPSLSSQHINLIEIIEFSLSEISKLYPTTHISSPLSPEGFSSLFSLLQLYRQCLEEALSLRGEQLSVGALRSRQVFSFEVVMEMLLLTLRHSSSSANIEVIEQCLPLVQLLVIDLKSTPLPLLETHQSLAASTFNLSLILYRNNQFNEAAPLLRIACGECLYCCQKCDNMEQKMIEVKLLTKYSLLIECLMRSGLYDDALVTIGEMLLLLYDNNITNKKLVTSFMTHYIDTKCSLRKSNGFNKQSLLKRSCIDWLEASTDDSLNILYLSEELKAYQSLSQDTREWQVTVTNQLLLLEEKNSYHYAWLLMKQATLHYSLNKEEVNGVLDEAAELLESMKEHESIRSDLLGLNYFWKGLFLHTTNMSTSDQYMNIKTMRQVHDVLSDAVKHWSIALVVINKSTSGPLSADEYFLDYNSTLHHLLLFSSFTNSLLLHSITLSLLNLILSLSDLFPTATDPVSYNQALASKTTLLLHQFGIKSITNDIVTKLCDVKVLEYSKESEILCVSQLECKVGLAAILIRKGEVSDALSLLKVIVSHPVLTHHRSHVQQLLSSIAILISHYLNSINEPPLPVEEFLSFLINTKYGNCNCTMCPCTDMKSGSFKLTDFELLFDALRLTQGLLGSLLSPSRYDLSPTDESIPLEEESVFAESSLLVTPAYRSWSIVSSLLSLCYEVSDRYLSQGLINDSAYYASKGMTLAGRLNLYYWNVKFTVHFAKIKVISGDSVAAIDYIQSSNRLLGIDEQQSTTIKSQSATTRSQSASTRSQSASTRSQSASTRSRSTRNQSQSTSIKSRTKPHSSTDSASISFNELCAGLQSLSLASTHESDLEYHILSIRLSLVTSDHHLLNEDSHSSLSTLDTNTAVLMNSLKKKTSDDITLPYELQCLQLRLRSLIHSNKLTEAGKVSQSLPSSSSHWSHLPSVRLALGGLHYYISVSLLEQLPTEIMEWLSSNNEEELPVTGSVKKKKKKTKKGRAMRITDSSEEEEEEEEEVERILGCRISPKLRPILSHLLLSVQYLTPVTLSCSLVRDVYQLLGYILTVLRTDLSVHFFILSSSISLNQETVFWFGRKIRKESGHFFKSFLTNLTEAISVSTPTITSQSLIQARSLLHPLPHPLTLDYTRGIIGRLPNDWVYCVCIMKEIVKGDHSIIIVRIKNDKDPILVKIRLKPDKAKCEGGGVVEEFTSLMSDSSYSVSLTNKKEWWDRRMKLDKKLQDLLGKVESKWLSHWRLLLLPSPSSVTPSSFSSLSSLLSSSGVYASTAWAEVLVNALKILDASEFTSLLLSILKNKRYSKAELGKAIEACLRDTSTNEKATSSPPLILSLSSSLQYLPFENLPILRDQLVTRIPSIQFLSASLLLHSDSRGSGGINPTDTYYVVNPTGDLKNTQRTFASWFEREAGWTGVIGRRPSTDEFIGGLKDHDTFIYCGHGNAKQYLGRNQKLQDLHTKATVIQMGCSSGKLESVGDLDPHGMALNFLIAGCPFLVANLWDVTDADIDRFCTSLVKNWLTDPSTASREGKRTHDDLLCSLSQARDTCKLKYLIGASPVVYGLPLRNRN